MTTPGLDPSRIGACRCNDVRARRPGRSSGERSGYGCRRRASSRGLSQERTAHLAGIASYTYQKFEKGESRPGTPLNPRLSTLLALCRVLEVRLEDLVPDEVPAPDER